MVGLVLVFILNIDLVWCVILLTLSNGIITIVSKCRPWLVNNNRNNPMIFIEFFMDHLKQWHWHALSFARGVYFLRGLKMKDDFLQPSSAYLRFRTIFIQQKWIGFGTMNLVIQNWTTNIKHVKPYYIKYLFLKAKHFYN